MRKLTQISVLCILSLFRRSFGASWKGARPRNVFNPETLSAELYEYARLVSISELWAYWMDFLLTAVIHSVHTVAAQESDIGEDTADDNSLISDGFGIIPASGNVREALLYRRGIFTASITYSHVSQPGLLVL